MPFSDRISFWSVVLLLLIGVAGCGGNSFVGKRLNNFTAYYNTFYNAQQAFQAGVQEIENSTAPIDRRSYMSIFGRPPRSGGHVRFQDAIDKSADVLRDHPRSKWVDDALLLIGKSYFYQENFVGAEQKFRETIELETGLDGEARIWLARTLIAAGALEEARDHLASSLEGEDVARRWEAQLHIALGELLVKQEAFDEAILELEEGLDRVRDNELEAKGAFLLGQVYETLGRYEESVEAYRRVQSAHPRYELSYAANLSAVRVQGMHVDAEGALETLRRMERDDKNYTNRYELAYVRGLIYQAQDRPEAARSVYRDILYDPEADVSALRGRLHYALGQLYVEHFEDYLVAAAHFDTARTGLATSTSSSRRGEAAPQYAPEAIVDAEERAAMFGSFAQVRRSIARMDSLLQLGELDEEAFAERILEIRRQKAQELAEQQRRAEQMQAERGFQDAAARSGGQQTTSARAENTGQAGFLYHRDPIRVQEARLNFITRWGERPRVPNWRRIDAVTAATADAGGSSDEPGSGVRDVDPSVGENPLPPLDYSDVPRDSLHQARMRAERALARYELGNVLFLSMEQPDSAAAWYRMVIEEDAAEEVAQRAYYALAEVQRSIGDREASRRLYEQVLRDYPESDFAGRVREQLGLPEPVSSDSMALAMGAYERAYERWQRGRYRDAFGDMLEIAARYRTTEAAPKALMAAGRIYMEWARSDTMDVFGPLPVTVSDSLLAEAGLIRRSAPNVAEPPVVDTLATPGADPAAQGERPRRRIEAEAGDEGVEEDVPGDRLQALRDVVEGRPPPPEGMSDAQDEVPIVRTPEEESMEDAVDAPDDVPRGVAEDAARNEVAEAVAPDSVEGTVPAPTLDDALDEAPADSVRERVAEAEPAPDSTVAGQAVALDSTLAPDDAAALTESGVPTDSTADASAGALLASAEPDPLYLRTLYASVRELYPSSAYAEQAGDMLDALEQRLREMNEPEPQWIVIDSLSADSLVGTAPRLDPGLLARLSDSTGTAADSIGTAADSTGATADTTASGEDPWRYDPEEIARQDSLDSERAREAERVASLREEAETSAEGDSTRAMGDPTEAERIPSDEAPVDARAAAEPEGDIPTGWASVMGAGGIRPELGGFTIVLGMNSEREPMEELIQTYVDKGYRAQVLIEHLGGQPVYRASLGHFPTADAAATALSDLAGELDEGGQVAPLSAP